VVVNSLVDVVVVAVENEREGFVDKNYKYLLRIY